VLLLRDASCTAGLINSANFTIYGFKIFEKNKKKYVKTRMNSEQTGEDIFQKQHRLVC
jgi:hypothetical protein